MRMRRRYGRVRAREEDGALQDDQAHGGREQHRHRRPHAHVHAGQPSHLGGAQPCATPAGSVWAAS